MSEYRIFQGAAEVLLNGSGLTRVFLSHGEVLHGDQADLPNSMNYLLCGQVLHGDQQNLKLGRVAVAGVEVLASVGQQINSIYLNDTPGVDGEVFSLQTLVEVTPGIMRLERREPNPFPATVMAVDPDEQQRTIREQHNKREAGDTTFDYGLLLEPTPDKLYTLGSLGKFYHDTYGMIHARYCKITQWEVVPFQGCPVGRLKDSAELDWTVTNRYELSDRNLVMGLTFFGVAPNEGEYGWVVVDGPNPFEIEVGTAQIPEPDATYSWMETGVLGLEIPGKIIARRWGKGTTPQLKAGSLKIKEEGLSTASMIGMVDEVVAPALLEIERVSEQGASNNAAIVTLFESTASLDDGLGAVRFDLARESEARARDIQSLRRLADSTDWASEIEAAKVDLRGEFTQADGDLRVLISEVEVKANRALAAASGGNSLADDQINSLTLQIVALKDRLLNFTVNYETPVDGDVLVSKTTTDPEGFVDTVFEPVAFKLENLNDVDVTTTPPADGDQLTWDEATSTWIPGAAGSGGGGATEVQDEGVVVVAAATKLDFAGAGVTVTDAGSGKALVTIPGGGGGGGGGMTLIQEFIVTTPLAVADFTSIPGTFRDLILTGQMRTSHPVAFNTAWLRFNNDSWFNYGYERVNRFGSDNGGSSTHIQFGVMPGSTSPAGNFASAEATIPNYSNDDCFKGLTGASFSFGDTPLHERFGGTWYNTAIIDRISIFPQNGDFVAGTVLRLWGVP